MRKNILFGVAVLLLALFLGAGLAQWEQPAISWASTRQQQQQLVTNAPVTAAQEAIVGIMPTQDVLADLYDQVAPSVVNIQVTVDTPVSTLPESPIPGFPFELPGDQGTPQPQQGEGSGFIFDMDGHIVTNNHVVENANSIVVYFSNGMWADAELVAADPQADLAVIKVTPPDGVNWQPLPLAAEDSVRVGYYVVAVGSPFGLDETMTTGIVSALGRSFQTGDATSSATYSLPNVIQTDAAINPGNSGGPLLNLAGEVVGVNFAINSPVRANSGVGFAIPVSVVQKVVPALISDGKYIYSYLGISGQTISAEVANEHDLPDNTMGVWVAEVVESGPAAEGGVQSGDIIVAIDGQSVTRFEDLISYLFTATTPGQTVTLEVLRAGERQSLEITVDERPQALQQQAEEGRSGEVNIAEAISTAKRAVQDSGLMETIDSANAKQDEANGRPVWVVTLTGNGSTATVIVDGQTGEVLELNVE